MISDHIRNCLKAYTALVGMIATTLLATHGHGTVGTVLTDLAAISTVVGVWAVPNAPVVPSVEPVRAPSSASEGAAE